MLQPTEPPGQGSNISLSGEYWGHICARITLAAENLKSEHLELRRQLLNFRMWKVRSLNSRTHGIIRVGAEGMERKGVIETEFKSSPCFFYKSWSLSWNDNFLLFSSWTLCLLKKEIKGNLNVTSFVKSFLSVLSVHFLLCFEMHFHVSWW